MKYNFTLDFGFIEKLYSGEVEADSEEKARELVLEQINVELKV